MVQEDVSQAETVSTEEQTSTTAEKVEATTEQPLTEERIQQLIDQATQRAVEQGKELGKREMQRIKDREVAEVKRERDLALKRSNLDLSTLDEETRERLELQRTQRELEYFQTKEQEEQAKRQQEEYFEKLSQSLKDEVTSMGIDPSDTRIDYAQDAPDYFEGRKRFNESLASIVKAREEEIKKTAIDDAEARFKALEEEFRKKNGLDSQDTTTGTGVVSESDTEWLSRFASGDIQVTKESLAKYNEITERRYK